ncbi:MAG: DUF3343 domain-containing protein [Clostridia bacterium]|nr:DUF3343 domain-containing protein [Clostridia bacterium]
MQNTEKTARRDPCLSPVGSITQALRARDVLAREGIGVTVVRNDPAATRHGCAYAISYPCDRERQIRGILRGAGLRLRGGAK